jgi:hypothetical protein
MIRLELCCASLVLLFGFGGLVRGPANITLPLIRFRTWGMITILGRFGFSLPRWNYIDFIGLIHTVLRYDGKRFLPCITSTHAAQINP